jgi:hypothetical protein
VGSWKPDGNAPGTAGVSPAGNTGSCLNRAEVLTQLVSQRSRISLHASNRMQKIIALLGLALLCAGCAGMAASEIPSTLGSLNPNTSGLEIHNQTELKLTEGNFSVMKTNVVGQARGFSLLGFITLVPARFQTAMDRLYARAQMQAGQPQTLGNIVMEKTSAYWILFSIPRVSVRADVVEFTPNHPVILIPHAPDDSKPGLPEGNKSGAPL